MSALIPYGGTTYRQLSSTERRVARRAAGTATLTPEFRLNQAGLEWLLATSLVTGFATLALGLFGVYLAFQTNVRAVPILLITAIDVAMTIRFFMQYRAFRHLVADSGHRPGETHQST
jgi:hypothetical protein